MNPKQLAYFIQFVLRKAQIHAIEMESDGRKKAKTVEKIMQKV